MKTLDGRGLTADQIALYQRLEAQRYPGFNPKNPAHWLLGVAVWPAPFMLLGGRIATALLGKASSCFHA